MKIDAVLWDYDGTLVNSAAKNMEINRQIIATVAPQKSGENLSKYLLSEDAYHAANHAAKNWQELYVRFYGLTELEMINAGKLWTSYQMNDNTPVKLFNGIKETIKELCLPQGICSQNSKENICALLKKHGMLGAFDAIIGYDSIPNDKQKPDPYGGLKCIDQLIVRPEGKRFLYIGDHEADVIFSKRIAEKLSPMAKLESVAVTYSGADVSTWKYQPDFVLNEPSDLFSIID